MIPAFGAQAAPAQCMDLTKRCRTNKRKTLPITDGAGAGAPKDAEIDAEKGGKKGGSGGRGGKKGELKAAGERDIEGEVAYEGEGGTGTYGLLYILLTYTILFQKKKQKSVENNRKVSNARASVRETAALVDC